MNQTKRMTRLALAAFVVFAGCSSSSSEDVAQVAQAVAEANTGADNEIDEPTEAAEPEFIPDATPLDDSVAPLSAGTYRIDSLSTPFSLTLPEDGFVERNADGKFIVTTSINTGRADDGLQFIRAARLPDPIDTLAYFEAIDEGWDPQDFAGWLDAMPSTITISNRIETTVGGFPAIRFDATQLPPPTCTFGVICGTFGSAGPWSAAIMTEGAEYRVWFVDLGDTDPVVIAAGISNEESVWFDTAEQIVNTIGFGEVQPNAIRIVDEGSIDLDVFDGIRVSSAESFWVNESSGAPPEIADIDWTFGVAEFLTRPNDASGSPIGIFRRARRVPGRRRHHCHRVGGHGHRWHRCSRLRCRRDRLRPNPLPNGRFRSNLRTNRSVALVGHRTPRAWSARNVRLLL